MASFTREEWLHLDTFLSTHPQFKRLGKVFQDNPDERFTLDALSRKVGAPVSMYDVKGLVVHGVVRAFTPDGHSIGLPINVKDHCVFAYNRENDELFRSVLAKERPAPPPETVYSAQPQHGPERKDVIDQFGFSHLQNIAPISKPKS